MMQEKEKEDYKIPWITCIKNDQVSSSALHCQLLFKSTSSEVCASMFVYFYHLISFVIFVSGLFL